MFLFFIDTVCTPELVKEACLQLKDVKWCDEVDFSCNDVSVIRAIHLVVDFGRITLYL